MWVSIPIAISGIAYYYWMGTEDMAAVYVAAGSFALGSANCANWQGFMFPHRLI
jgi:hypothetical protein